MRLHCNQPAAGRSVIRPGSDLDSVAIYAPRIGVYEGWCDGGQRGDGRG